MFPATLLTLPNLCKKIAQQSKQENIFKLYILLCLFAMVLCLKRNKTTQTFVHWADKYQRPSRSHMHKHIFPESPALFLLHSNGEEGRLCAWPSSALL